MGPLLTGSPASAVPVPCPSPPSSPSGLGSLWLRLLLTAGFCMPLWQGKRSQTWGTRSLSRVPAFPPCPFPELAELKAFSTVYTLGVHERPPGALVQLENVPSASLPASPSTPW